MGKFYYTALKDFKTVVSGYVESNDVVEARRKVAAMGIVPTSVRSTDDNASKKKNVKGQVSTLSLREKIDFTSTLEILTSTGIPIIEALMFIEQNTESKKIKTLTNDFRNQIIDGATLGEALEKYRDIFGKVYIGLVKAGEDAGELDKTLVRMLELLKKQDATKTKVIGALIYPAIVVFLAIVAVVIMLVFVFPAFDELFNNLGKPLPPITKMCMTMGVFMKKYWFICIGAVIFFVVALRIAMQKPSIQRAVDDFVLRIPLFSELMKYSNFSNFIAVLQVSYEAGIPIVDCLYLANLTMDNHLLRSAILQVATKVRQGTHLSIALKSVSQVPSMMTFMIATGEQSGRLGDSLYHCVTFIDKKLDSIIDGFTKLIEPLLMVFIGFIVAFLGLALYLPLFQAYQQ